MKIAVICLLVALAVAEISAQSHNNEWGTKGPNDRLIFRELSVKKSAIDQIVTTDVEYRGAITISAVKCTDHYTNNNGGFATLQSGGPRYTVVTLHFTSQRGHGINFTVEVYGPHN